AAGAGGLALALSTTSATGAFRSLADAPITSVTVPAGSSSASFKYRDTAVGSPTITAAETPSAGLTDAGQVVTVIAPVKQDQTISFGPLANATYGDPSVQLAATASSGLSVVYTAGGSCSVSGSTVSLTGTGTCTI